MYRIGKEEIAEVSKVLDCGQLFKVNNGCRETENAEKEMREFFGGEYSLLMSSGHAALASALVALGIGPGDEVIVPAYTYIATAMVVVEAGAIPVICEIDDSLTLDPVDVEKKISKHTKAIMPVHIQGFPCKMDEICAIAKKHNIAIIEDACQADGGSYKGKRLGTIGDAGAFSFNHFKIITAGEGGALITNNREIFERALIYHDSNAVAFFGEQLNGFTTETFCGKEYRTNEVSAAILREQLKKLDGILFDLRKNKKALAQLLDGVCKFATSNDIEGDCGVMLPLIFESQESASAVANEIVGTVPINTGKHVYKNWTPIMNKRGAYHPLMDPFKMPANKDIVPNYTEDMCPTTLDLLSRVVYVAIDPEWTDEQVKERAEQVKAAVAKIK